MKKKQSNNSNLAFKKLIKSYINECLKEVVSDFSFKLMIKEVIRESINESVEQVLENTQAQRAFPSVQRKKMNLNEHLMDDANDEEENVNAEEEFLNKRRRLLEMQFSNGPSARNRKKSSSNEGFDYSSIFEDTLRSGHPLVTGEDSGADMSEGMSYDAPSGAEIPDTVLEEAGLMNKDWSRHIGID